jgi:hypothetical protein
MALAVLVVEIMISRLDGLGALVLHSMDLVSITHTTIIAQQVQSLVLTVLIRALAESEMSPLAGQTTTEIDRYHIEIANNSLLFFTTVSRDVFYFFYFTKELGLGGALTMSVHDYHD